MSIIAKPVVNQQFWILQDDDQRKVGNVEAHPDGFKVKINNKTSVYDSLTMIELTRDIKFIDTNTSEVIQKDSHSVYGYPTVRQPFNAVWNVPMKLPLYTKNEESCSFIAAGWYGLKQGKEWEVIQDPKLILLQRYDYSGPFISKQKALTNLQGENNE